MGIYDRDYYQGERQPGMHLGGEWSIVGQLVAVNVAVFLAEMFLFQGLMKQMAASPNSVAEPWRIWQLVTYGFAHDNTDGNIAHIFWNMFGLFVFGRDVEAIYGRKEFLRFYLVTVFLGGLLFALRGMVTFDPDLWDRYVVVGASGAVTGVTLLFCIHFPKRTLLLMMVLPVPAWAVGLLIILVNVWGVFGSTQNVAFDVHLVGAVFAIAYYKLGWNLGRFVPDFSQSRGWLRAKPKPKLKIHEPAIDDPYRSLDADADMLLAKVKREGVGSLSPKERRALEDYSRRMRQKHS